MRLHDFSPVNWTWSHRYISWIHNRIKHSRCYCNVCSSLCVDTTNLSTRIHTEVLVRIDPIIQFFFRDPFLTSSLCQCLTFSIADLAFSNLILVVHRFVFIFFSLARPRPIVLWCEMFWHFTKDNIRFISFTLYLRQCCWMVRFLHPFSFSRFIIIFFPYNLFYVWCGRLRTRSRREMRAYYSSTIKYISSCLNKRKKLLKNHIRTYTFR